MLYARNCVNVDGDALHPEAVKHKHLLGRKRFLRVGIELFVVSVMKLKALRSSEKNKRWANLCSLLPPHGKTLTLLKTFSRLKPKERKKEEKFNSFLAKEKFKT